MKERHLIIRENHRGNETESLVFLDETMQSLDLKVLQKEDKGREDQCFDFYVQQTKSYDDDDNRHAYNSIPKY